MIIAKTTISFELTDTQKEDLEKCISTISEYIEFFSKDTSFDKARADKLLSASNILREVKKGSIELPNEKVLEKKEKPKPQKKGLPIFDDEEEDEEEVVSISFPK